MSLILRAQVAAAAQSVVPSWPLDSFIAVNPLARFESGSFDAAAMDDVALTRKRDAYLVDFQLGRITELDLEAALLERIPDLAAELDIDGATVPAVRLAVLDMMNAGWGSEAVTAGSTLWLDDYLSAWVSSYLTPNPLWPMPHKQLGLFLAWRTLARRDPSLPAAVRRALRDVPLEPDAALEWALDRLDIQAAEVTHCLTSELTYLPGWVGHIKWRAEKVGDVDLISYLAVRFVIRALLGITLSARKSGSATTISNGQIFWERAEHVASLIVGITPSRQHTGAVAGVLASHPVSDHPFTWQKAYEIHYRSALVARLERPDGPGGIDASPTFQLVMCIDPRSEGMRRHLEKAPTVETFGFAGFFGIPVRFARYGARGGINSLPALLTARHTITENPANLANAERHVARGRSRDALRRATHIADSSTVTPFAFAETTGWLYGAASILRTFAPSVFAATTRALISSPRTLAGTVTVADAFTVEESAAMAETAVRMMGLSEFAPLVVLAGHSSESANNLYESALDCGACGGNPGAANARAAAAIFNDPEVRELLRLRGIDIPPGTYFVAADHNTVSDVVALLDPHLIPASHRELTRQFDQLQRVAAEQLVRERALNLPGARARGSVSKLRARAHDWSEVYPELGLAGNAAMIIGPRSMTRAVNLDRRVFLHSYETQLDPDGTALESIMTAPLVVAQWINHQYYFSALNPSSLGAGTKTIHNAIDTIGVIAGQGGDLRRGLPWQSVGVGTDLFHEPMRLCVMVQAPLERVGDIVSRNQVLRNLFDNDWITLTARNDSGAAWHRYTRYGWNDTSTTMEGP